MTALGSIDQCDEESLPERLSSDLDGVFAEVVSTYEAAVFTTAARLSHGPTDAEDLTAETFLRAYAGLRTYAPARVACLQLRPWLITICLNLWRNQVRASSRRPPVAGRVAPGGPAENPGAGNPHGDAPDHQANSPEDWTERRDVADRLTTALRQLPAKQRIAVVLRHIVGLSSAEVAEVLACPEGTARSHVSRGLDGLRLLLAHDQEMLP